MGVHDIETMNLLSRELHKIKPDILLYGEGWTAGSSPLPDADRALKANASKLDRIAVFSDDLRDGIKGSVFENSDRGFASGKKGMEASIKFGVVAALPHDQVDYAKVNYSKAPYTKEPFQFISYCECHDNHVLWDKLKISCPEASITTRTSMHQLALSIVLTSQGIAFLHAGTEFLRSKNGVENSFESGDSINAIDWDLKTTNKEVFSYIKTLVAMRKAHPAFRMMKAGDIKSNLRFVENVPEGIIAYTLDGQAVKDSWGKILVVYNGSAEEKTLTGQGSDWKAYIRNNKLRTAGQSKIVGEEIVVAAYSCSVFFE
jgi:pullulanase